MKRASFLEMPRAVRAAAPPRRPRPPRSVPGPCAPGAGPRSRPRSRVGQRQPGPAGHAREGLDPRIVVEHRLDVGDEAVGDLDRSALGQLDREAELALRELRHEVEPQPGHQGDRAPTDQQRHPDDREPRAQGDPQRHRGSLSSARRDCGRTATTAGAPRMASSRPRPKTDCQSAQTIQAGIPTTANRAARRTRPGASTVGAAERSATEPPISRGQHRDQGQRDRQRGEQRERDGHRHVTEQLGRDALQEQHRDEHGDGGQRGGDHRASDLGGTDTGGLERPNLPPPAAGRSTPAPRSRCPPASRPPGPGLPAT